MSPHETRYGANGHVEEPATMVAYFCHHLSDNYVDLSEIYVDLSDLYVDLSDLYVDLSLISSVESKHENVNMPSKCHVNNYIII